MTTAGPECCHKCEFHLCVPFVSDKHFQLAHDLVEYEEGAPVKVAFRCGDVEAVRDEVCCTRHQIELQVMYLCGWADGHLDDLAMWLVAAEG